MRLAWVVLLAACDKVFGLSPVADALPESACAAPDEDDDCIVNDVDNCPGIPNSEQLDGDNDAIGDDCDPMPMLAGDRRVRFFAFDDPSEADAFVDLTVNGKWVHAPGEMRHSETMDNNASLHSETASTSTFFAIEAGFRFAAWSTDQTISTRIGVRLDNAYTVNAGHTCWIEPNPDTGGRVLLQEHVPGTDGMATSRPMASPVRNDRVRVTFARDLSTRQLACRITVSTTTEVLPPVTETMPWTADRFYSFTAANAGVALTYVALYER